MIRFLARTLSWLEVRRTWGARHPQRPRPNRPKCVAWTAHDRPFSD